MYKSFINLRMKTFLVETDHKPLILIFRKELMKAPQRTCYFEIQYCPGNQLYIADALSRNKNGAIEEDIEINFQVAKIRSTLPMSNRAFKEFQEETGKNELLQILRNKIKEGWNEGMNDFHDTIKCYEHVKDELWEHLGLIWKGEQLIVPRSLRKRMLQLIHEGHLGIVKCKLRAKQALLWWPRINGEIEDYINKCNVCQKYNNKQEKQPIVVHECGYHPFEKIGIEIFEINGEHYLIAVDYFSNYPELFMLETMST